MIVGTSITLGISFLLLVSIAIFLYLKYRKIPVVQEKAIFIKQKKEIENELEDLRQQYIIQGLRDTKILDEKIRRFGKSSKEKLIANGISTAYDVTFDRGSSISDFVKSKTNSLIAWRDSVESQLDATKPRRLPPEKEEKIRDFYIKQYEQLDEILAGENKNYVIDIQQIKDNAIHKLEQNDEDEAQLKKQLSPLLGELEIAERRTEPFSRIAFFNYVEKFLGRVLYENKFMKADHAVIVIGFLVLTILSQCLLGCTAAGSLIDSMIPTNTPTFTQTYTPTNTRTSTLTFTPTETPTPTETSLINRTSLPKTKLLFSFAEEVAKSPDSGASIPI